MRRIERSRTRKAAATAACVGTLAVWGVLAACAGDEPVPTPRGEAATKEILLARTNGLTFLQQDRLDDAEAEFERLIELAPREPVGYASLALVHLRAGKLEAAEESVRRALEIAPDDPEVRLTLARVLEEDGRGAAALQELRAIAEEHPDHARTLYALARLAPEGPEPETTRDRVALLERLILVDPANLAVRLELAEALLRIDRTDSAVAHLEALRQQAPDFPPRATAPFEEAIQLARTGRPAEALDRLAGFRRYFELTPPYQEAMAELRAPSGELAGRLDLVFSHEFSLQIQEEEAVLAALRFSDATAVAGLDVVTGVEAPAPEDGPAAILAAGDFDGDGDVDLYAVTAAAGAESRLFRSDLGRFVEITHEAGLGDVGLPRAAAFGDFDDDRRLDLFVIDADVATLYHNERDGFFSDVTGLAGVAEAGGGRRVLFADLDQDGDLDLFVPGTGPNRFYRNNGDGSFEERAVEAGLAGDATADSRDASFGDLDGDRDLDLVVANANGPLALLFNQRGGRFTDETETAGLAGAAASRPGFEGAGAVAVGDYDNDGWLDLFAAGAAGGHALFRNQGDGSFAPDERSTATLASLGGLHARDAAFLDFDNDGHLDIALAGHRVGGDGSGAGVALLRNDGTGRFGDASRFLPEGLAARVERLAPADYNDDGDLDLFLAEGDGRLRLLRNDGANVNHYFKIELTGLGEGSRKNNRFGIGSRIEMRAGDLHQVRVVRDRITHFGLDGRLKPDVVRVEWTNGVAQDLFYPGSDQDLIEEQTLKGSCPLVYGWNGEAYEFITDVMWKSALGMPLGIMGARGGRALAPAGASREYVGIPGDALRPREGVYSLQITEELWETIYLDQVKLLAVDHPDSIDVFIDERFVPPGPASLRLHPVAEPRTPISAVDDRGIDQLPAIREKDDIYVSNLVPGRYQGLTRPHDLTLDLGELARAERVVLFLNGWVFPTDASINVALAQSDAHEAVFPYLQVVGEDGEWRTVAELGIPSGKNKTVVAELSGLFPTDDRRVRIRTNMQVYWDRIFFTAGPAADPEPPLAPRELAPASADLHYRGFSRVYRRGGRYGPHWFDYSEVTTEPRWSDLAGYYTRYGDVRPLLVEADDMYVIMNAGDEITVDFEASGLPELRDGWSRDFLLYTDGWIKDGDLNTATGATVEPLPFHGQSRYPYGPGESYPDDEAHREYVRLYNTRKVEPDF